MLLKRRKKVHYSMSSNLKLNIMKLCQGPSQTWIKNDEDKMTFCLFLEKRFKGDCIVWEKPNINAQYLKVIRDN
jgi:hypothetical protein